MFVAIDLTLTAKWMFQDENRFVVLPFVTVKLPAKRQEWLLLPPLKTSQSVFPVATTCGCQFTIHSGRAVGQMTVLFIFDEMLVI